MEYGLCELRSALLVNDSLVIPLLTKSYKKISK